MHLESLQSVVVNLIIAQKWKEASNLRTVILDTLQSATGLDTLCDFTRETDCPIEMISGFLDKQDVKEALGVSKDVHFQLISDDVMKALHEDVMKSAEVHGWRIGEKEPSIVISRGVWFERRCGLDGVMAERDAVGLLGGVFEGLKKGLEQWRGAYLVCAAVCKFERSCTVRSLPLCSAWSAAERAKDDRALGLEQGFVLWWRGKSWHAWEV